MTKKCPDCGAAVGVSHHQDCDVARCSLCGVQRLSCVHADGDGDGGIWTGEWPGLLECRELNLFAKLVANRGFVPVSRDDPDATEDLNCLISMGVRGELVWNGARWILPPSDETAVEPVGP